MGNNFLLRLLDLKHLQLLPEDFPRYRGEKYTVSNSRQNPTESVEARITTDTGSNTAAGTIHWNNGASQKIFWDKTKEGEKSVENIKATKADTGDSEVDATGANTEREENSTENTEVGESTESKNDHNGQDLPEGLEDMEGLCDPEDEPKFPNDLDCEVLAMCKRYKTVFSEHLKCGRHIKGAPMRINLVPEEKRVKPLYHAVPRVVPLHWREEADKIVKNLLKHNIIEQVDYPTSWCSQAFFMAKPGGSRGFAWSRTFVI